MSETVQEQLILNTKVLFLRLSLKKQNNGLRLFTAIFRLNSKGITKHDYLALTKPIIRTHL